MFKCLLIDDEMPALEELEYLIKKHSDYQVLGKFTNGRDLLESYLLKDTDVLFLDINMPGINGISLAKQVLEIRKDILIIFVTAYDEYAVKAFEINALDYILKPISEKRFINTMRRVSAMIEEGQTADQTEEHFGKIKQIFEYFLMTSKPITFYRDGKHYPVSFDEIYYIYSENRCTKVVTEKGVFQTKRTLNEMEKSLKANRIYRCHKSYIVNIDHVEEIIPWFNQTYVLKVTDSDVEIPVSRNKLKEFKKMMNIL